MQGFPCCRVFLWLQRTGCAFRRLLLSCSQAPEHRLSSCDSGASLPLSMCYLPGSGIQPTSPAVAARSLTEPPGKSGPSVVYPGDRAASWELSLTADPQQPGTAADCLSLVQRKIKIQSSVSTRYLSLLHHFKTKKPEKSYCPALGTICTLIGEKIKLYAKTYIWDLKLKSQ